MQLVTTEHGYSGSGLFEMMNKDGSDAFQKSGQAPGAGVGVRFAACGGCRVFEKLSEAG